MVTYVDTDQQLDELFLIAATQDCEGIVQHINNNTQILIISQYEYDILVITRIRGKAKDEC